MSEFHQFKQVPAAWQTDIVCPQCNEIIDSGDKFCTFCGSPRSETLSPIRYAEVEHVKSDIKAVKTRLNLFRIFWLFILLISVVYLMGVFPYSILLNFFWKLPDNSYFLLAIAFGAAYSHRFPAFFYGSALAYSILIPTGSYLMGGIELDGLMWGFAFGALSLIGFIQAWKITNYKENYPELYESTL